MKTLEIDPIYFEKIEDLLPYSIQKRMIGNTIWSKNRFKDGVYISKLIETLYQNQDYNDDNDNDTDDFELGYPTI
jgi:hypothetical protein